MFRIETSISSTLRISDSMKLSDGQVVPVIDGICSLSEVVSPNGYRYKKTFWPKVFSQPYFKDSISQRTSLGTVEHPEKDEDYLRTPYLDASHVVVGAELRDSNPFCKFALINNEKGNGIKALVDLNVPVGVSTRGLGETLSDSISPFIDEDNYAWITWDIVNNPNFSDLRMKLISDSAKASPIFKELVDAYQLRDSGVLSFDKSRLLKEMDKMKDSLRTMMTLVNAEFTKESDKVFSNKQIKDSLFTELDYNNLQFENCELVSFPDSLKVEGNIRFINCKGKLPDSLSCNILDIRGCKEITSLPSYLVADTIYAQGSGLKSLPENLNCKRINIVDTQVTEVPQRAIVEELRAKDSVEVKGIVKNFIKF